MKAKLHWNPCIEYWIMRDMLGAFMQEFRDCQNFRREYPGLDKAKVNVVEVSGGQVVATYEKAQDGF